MVNHVATLLMALNTLPEEVFYTIMACTTPVYQQDFEDFELEFTRQQGLRAVLSPSVHPHSISSWSLPATLQWHYEVIGTKSDLKLACNSVSFPSEA